MKINIEREFEIDLGEISLNDLLKEMAERIEYADCLMNAVNQAKLRYVKDKFLCNLEEIGQFINEPQSYLEGN